MEAAKMKLQLINIKNKLDILILHLMKK